MWILFAFGSALFAGLTAILAKIGIRSTDSNLATALRTVVVLAFSWLLVLLQGSWRGLGQLSGRTFAFLILSGLATGASWLCYFRALQLGDVNKVTPIDKSSTLLTMLLAFLFFHEPIGPLKAFCICLIGLGTWLMIPKKPGVQTRQTGRGWMFYALAGAVFASLTSILGKAGMEHIDSNLGTAIRTVVVLCMAWAVVFMTGKQRELPQIDRKSWIFLVLSGFATGASWLCYYRALQLGPASVVVPIDKLSILVTILFSRLVFQEHLSRRAGGGLALIVAGTLLLLV